MRYFILFVCFVCSSIAGAGDGPINRKPWHLHLVGDKLVELRSDAPPPRLEIVVAPTDPDEARPELFTYIVGYRPKTPCDPGARRQLLVGRVMYGVSRYEDVAGALCDRTGRWLVVFIEGVSPFSDDVADYTAAANVVYVYDKGRYVRDAMVDAYRLAVWWAPLSLVTNHEVRP